MMRGVSTWAVAVRKPSPEQVASGRNLEPGEAATGEIEITSFPLVSVLRRHRLLRLPVLRGVVALVESLRIGYEALAISANAQLGEDDKEIAGGAWWGTVALSIAFAVGLFFLIPVGITSLFKDALPNSIVFVVVEKLIRIAIFLGYLWLISRMHALRRVFEYHGAEHKTISCYEAGLDLTPENAQRFSRLHPRCGTSFLLIVMLVAIVVFAPLGTPAWYWLFLSRIVGHPARRRPRVRDHQVLRPPPQPPLGAGAHVAGHAAPAPDDARAGRDQLAVAIAALQAVLDVERPEDATEEERIGMEVVA